MLSLDAFIAKFSDEFNPDDIDLTADSSLFDELGLDSFDVFRLLILLEELSDIAFSPDSIPPIYTVGMAYEYYRQLVKYAEPV